MPIEQFDTQGFIRSIIARGWHWDDADASLLLHPTNHDFYLRYDRLTDRLSLSPDLETHLHLVIPTPSSKSKTFR
jgi:hypothetical protein